jgi:hypothetical protein
MTLRRINIDTVSPRIALVTKLNPPAKSLKTTQIIDIASSGTNGTTVAIEVLEKNLSLKLGEQGEPNDYDVQ